MSERAWLVRDQIRRVVSQVPPPPATWLAVVRRTVVVVGFFVAGIATDNLPLTVLACFGALQTGLLEVALPFRSLLNLMVWMVATTTVAVLIAMLVGGTWAAVVYIALLAYVFGSTASLSPVFATLGISTLAIAVIFCGYPESLPTAWEHAQWVALGAATQGLVALALWRVERAHFVRRALANKVTADMRLLRTSTVEPDALVAAHAATDEVSRVLASAGLPSQQDRDARLLLSDAVVMTRGVVAWLVLREPGVAERMRASLALQWVARVLTFGRLLRRPFTPRALQGVPVDTGIPQLTADIGDWREGRLIVDRTVHSLAMPQPKAPRVTWAQVGHALLPHGRLSRHGVRMAVGLFIAEAVTVVLPVSHSFWLPLTVVFTLKPDWTFTVIRGLNRTLGNLLAVVLLPAVMLALGGSDVAYVVPLAILVAITYRWFFGNYLVASFGLAGSVLLLDLIVAPGDDLFLMRIAAAVLGALLSLAVALAIPHWRSDDAPALVDELEESLTLLLVRTRRELSAMRAGDEASAGELESLIMRARGAVQRLEPVATGALLEPRSTSHPTQLSLVHTTSARLLTELIATGHLVFIPQNSDLRHGVPVDGLLERIENAEQDWRGTMLQYRHPTVG